MSEEREQYIAALREVADALEENPEMPMPFFRDFVVQVSTAEELAEAARAIPGQVTKRQMEGNFVVERLFSGVPYVVSAMGVCKKVKKGTRKRQVPVTKVVGSREVESPVYEYECPPSLLGNGRGQ